MHDLSVPANSALEGFVAKGREGVEDCGRSLVCWCRERVHAFAAPRSGEEVRCMFMAVEPGDYDATPSLQTEARTRPRCIGKRVEGERVWKLA